MRTERDKARAAKRVDDFYTSPEWRKARGIVRKRANYKCSRCGVQCRRHKGEAGPMPHVDHIKPRKTHPDLALELYNLRVLCAPCHSHITHHRTPHRDPVGVDGYPVEAPTEPHRGC